MTGIADGSVIIQTSAASVPAPPAWFGEVVLLAALLRKHGVLTKISELVRGCRGDVLGADLVLAFLAVQIALCQKLRVHPGGGSRERLQPFAVPFMALFERDRLRARSTRSRDFSALTQEPVEAALQALSRRLAESPTLDRLPREANRGPGGSSGKHLGGL